MVHPGSGVQAAPLNHRARKWARWLLAGNLGAVTQRGQDSQVVLVVKNRSVSAGEVIHVSLIPWSGRSSGEGKGNSLQCSCHGQKSLAGHGVTKSWT